MPRDFVTVVQETDGLSIVVGCGWTKQPKHDPDKVHAKATHYTIDPGAESAPDMISGFLEAELSAGVGKI